MTESIDQSYAHARFRQLTLQSLVPILSRQPGNKPPSVASFDRQTLLIRELDVVEILDVLTNGNIGIICAEHDLLQRHKIKQSRHRWPVGGIRRLEIELLESSASIPLGATRWRLSARSFASVATRPNWRDNVLEIGSVTGDFDAT